MVNIGGGGQGDGAGFQAQLGVEDEAQDDQHDDHHALNEQGTVFDRLFRVQAMNGFHGLRLDPELAAIDEVEADQRSGQDKDHGHTGVGDEIHKAQAGGAADHDVGGVADEGGGAADVRGHDLGHEEGDGVDLQHVRDGQRHGADQQHGGHVVQKGG